MSEKDGDELLLETDDSLVINQEATIKPEITTEPLSVEVAIGTLEAVVKEVVDPKGKPSDEKTNPSGLTKKDSKRSSGEGPTQVEPQKQSTSSEVNKKLKAGAKPLKEVVHLQDILAQIQVANTYRKKIPAAKSMPQTKTPLAASTPKTADRTGTPRKPLAATFNKPGPIP